MTHSLQTPAIEATGQAPAQVLIPQLSLQSMFWRPKYPTDSSWRMHLPVAFWLVEAQRPQRVVELGTEDGASWFAFCQALERLNPYAECLAFTAGPPDPALREHTEAQYQEFASVQQASQDEALGRLQEESVDILHVAPGVAQPIAREWARWQARLSSRGVVLISQAGPGQPGESLFQQVRDGRPHFLFEQGQGLGIVAIGSHRTETLERLLGFQSGQPGQRLIQQVFTRLGLACCASAPEIEARLSPERRSAEPPQAPSDTRIESLEQRNAELQAALQARDEALESERSTRFEETARLTELLQSAEEARDQARKSIAEREASLQELQRERARLETALTTESEKARQLAPLEQEHAALEQEHAALKRRVEETEASLRHAREEADGHRKAHETLQQDYQTLERRREEQARELEQKSQQLEALEAAGRESECQLVELQQQRDTAERAQAARDRENVALREAQDARFAELAELTRMLEEKERQLAELSARPKRLVESLSALGAGVTGRGGRRLKEDLRLVKASGLFDSDWYLHHNPDVQQSGMPGLEHFVRFGGQEGRSPGPAFDSQWYLSEYPDVADAQANPLVHYLRFGQQEDRLPKPDAWEGERHGS
ncbi:class I SAM-dependent methyltransferase [Halomonas nitroreducens]|nr:class I SAM-dependent methyltransferase [Halomonas nitroreducens]